MTTAEDQRFEWPRRNAILVLIVTGGLVGALVALAVCWSHITSVRKLAVSYPDAVYNWQETVDGDTIHFKLSVHDAHPSIWTHNGVYRLEVDPFDVADDPRAERILELARKKMATITPHASRISFSDGTATKIDSALFAAAQVVMPIAALIVIVLIAASCSVAFGLLFSGRTNKRLSLNHKSRSDITVD